MMNEYLNCHEKEKLQNSEPADQRRYTDFSSSLNCFGEGQETKEKEKEEVLSILMRQKAVRWLMVGTGCIDVNWQSPRWQNSWEPIKPHHQSGLTAAQNELYRPL